MKITINYWEDKCPICHDNCINACRCPRNDRQCKNNHYWHRKDNGDAEILTEPHGEVIKIIPFKVKMIEQENMIDPTIFAKDIFEQEVILALAEIINLLKSMDRELDTIQREIETIRLQS